MQVIAKAYVVDHLVVSSINKDILKWCLFLWFGDIIEEITLLMGRYQKFMKRKFLTWYCIIPLISPMLILHNLLDYKHERRNGGF